MKFTYELSGIGWASGMLEINNQESYFNVSYLSEPIKDLLDGLLQLLPGCVPEDELQTEVTFEWYSEPGGLKWMLKCLGHEKLNISIVSYADMYCKSEANKSVEIETECSLFDFINEVVLAFEQLIVKHGFVGYRSTWCRGEFPLSSLLILKNYMNTRKPFPSEIDYNDGIEVEKTSIKEEMKLLLQVTL
ncbi:hypothetical protein [Paenibacillus sp. 481]|uniref:hypothetical protein n=1 Tax=Paenibacillus sp. 481 TaxID=2835869 RepID=UPI001E63009A|nr:hypothetical protein [Paenibacillus sp. 481]UHA71924.1 hypothetical protein KIK04_14415 [Paenibacillus sp. 481]